MSELLIMAYPKVEYSEDGKSFKVATVFGDIPLICLMTVPKETFELIELEIEEILEHETIGIFLSKLDDTLHTKFDNLFPYTHSLYKELNEGFKHER